MRVTIVGLAGVPFSKRAIDVRLNASIKLFLKLGFQVDVLNRYLSLKEKVYTEGFNLINPFANSYNGGKLVSLSKYIASLLYEPMRLFGMNRKEHIDVLFVNSGHFVDMFIYWIISRIIGAKVVYQYCEYRAAFETSNLYHKINGKLIGKFGAKFWDGAICITTFLEKDCKKNNSKIKTLRMYPICNYDEFKEVAPYSPGFDYVMFCGSVEYKDVVDLIVNAYNCSRVKETKKCIMVLRGSKSLIEEFQIAHPEIIIESDLLYPDLIARYKGASALMIPLRNNIRDIARFPNKVCEYCASENVIVTSNNGEMKYLFKDGINAFVSNDFSVSGFASALDRFEGSTETKSISKKSYTLGLNFFNIDAYCVPTKKFIESVIH